MPILFQTSRLSIRPLTMADLDLFFAMQSDAELMHFIRPPEQDREAVRTRVAFLEQYAQDYPGLGSMVALWKTTGQPAASCVIRHTEYQPDKDLEIGYMVLRDFWGQGLATEIATGLSDYAFAQLDAPRVTAFVDPEHRASQRVLEKSGFRLARRLFIYDTDNFEFVKEAV